MRQSSDPLQRPPLTPSRIKFLDDNLRGSEIFECVSSLFNRGVFLTGHWSGVGNSSGNLKRKLPKTKKDHRGRLTPVVYT